MDAVAVVGDRIGINGRGNRAVRVLRTVFRFLDRFAPALAARLAERLWCTPPRHPRSPRARARLQTAQPFVVRWEGRRLAAWRWGEGPVVYLMHGWGGDAGDLTEFASPLAQQGFCVAAFDAPGHGDSEGGPSGWRQSNFLEFASALRAVARIVGPPFGIVAHSGGVASIALALRQGLHADRLVFLASMAEPESYTRLFAQALGLSDPVVRAMKLRLAHRLRFRWDELSVPRTASAIAVPQTLILHDRDDPEAPWSGAAEITRAWPESRLITTVGLGHRRLLKDPGVREDVVAFLSSGGT